MFGKNMIINSINRHIEAVKKVMENEMISGNATKQPEIIENAENIFF